MTVEALIREVTGGFGTGIAPSDEYLLAEYNMLIRTLFLSLPGTDKSVSLSPSEGKLVTELHPMQVRRVFCGEDELLRGSVALLELLPDAKLYCAAADGILVTVAKECTVYYRDIPVEATLEYMYKDEFPLDVRYIPLVRAWLWHRAYLYIGDFECADAYGTEYNRLLEDFKTENGVDA